MWKVTLGLIASFSFACGSFPNDPVPCKYGDEACFMDRTNYFLSEQSNGNKAINLIKIDPLTVKKVSISQGAKSPVNINLTFTNNDIIGIKNARAFKIKGFGKDMTQKSEIHLRAPHIMLIGDYTISGKVLILPINGNGKSNMSLKNIDFALIFNGTPYEKDGETYMKITNMKIDARPERIYYFFGNLFNGDKALGDNMNLFLNDNWKEIFEEVRESLQNAFARIFEQVLNNVFSKNPYEKYFLAEESS